MSYVDRLQPQITFTSPSGLVFEAKWIGDSINQEKDLGIFKTPGVAGAKIQDLKLGAKVYPLTIHFDGPDNDLESQNFIDALSEDGNWTVIHPLKGEITVNLVSFSEAVEPITSGNITTITTEWIEITGDSGETSSAQLSGLALAQNIQLQETGSDQINQVASLDTADKAGKFKTAVENTVTAFDLTLKNITDQVAEVQSQADSIKRGIDNTLAESPIDILSIAGQIQALVSLPNLVITDLNSKIETYSRFADLILDISPEAATPAGINTAAVQELGLTAALGSVGVASVTSDLVSRQSVIDSINSNIALFNTITDGLDVIQEIYSGELLSRSYFSQSDTFPDAAYMLSVTVAYLIKSSFDLAIEKRITLTRKENPVMIAMREYGGPGENDANINLFYDSNELTDQETYLLPVGKEVVVYV
jgi:prophage DNA circulation protein